MNHQQQTISDDKLPWPVRACFHGITLSLLGLSAGGLATNVIDIFAPIRGNGIPIWLWPILILIWTPGIVGLCLGYYAIIRYPYLSLATGWQPTLTSTRWLWVLLGVIFWMIALMFSLVFLIELFSRPLDVWGLVACGYFAIECWFAGFLLIIFRAERHPTIATFIQLSLGIGIALLPFYIPALLAGGIRCRTFLATIESTDNRS